MICPTLDDINAELARRHLGDYGAWVHGLTPARHHGMWIERISALVGGRSTKRKTLILAPPGSAKTTWLSLIFPPWYLGNHPTHSLLFFTSSDTMSGQYGGTVKHTLESNERHALTFPLPSCRPDRVRGWSSDGLYLAGIPPSGKDPSYRAVGYGASVVGSRAHGIILDDPLTQESSQSAAEQERAKRYFDMTVDSRLHPGGWILAIATRWHELDLAGHFMNKPDWDVLAMPALGEYPWGKALWPERFSVDWLEAKRKDMGGPMFAALYMTDVSALGGSVFKESAWFRPLPTDFDEPADGEDPRTPRERLTVCQFWDLAFSTRDSADYTVCLTLGVDKSLRLYVLNVLRKRLSPDETVAAMVDQITLYRPAIVGVEEAAYKQSVTLELLRRVRKLVVFAAFPIKPSTDKVTRALLPAARAEAGMLFVDRDAPWFPQFETECRGFPLAAHDDQVDALSGAVQLVVDRLSTRPRPTEPHYYGFRSHSVVTT